MKRRSQGGFSMVELCVGLALSVVVVGAVLVSYLSSAETARQARALTQMTEDAQTALLLLRRDVQSAGAVEPAAFAAATGLFAARQSDPAVFGCDAGFDVPGAPLNGLACATTAGTPAISLSFEATADTAIISGAPPALRDCVGGAITVSTQPAGGTGAFTSHRYFVRKGPAGRNELYCASQDSPAQALIDGVEALSFTYGVAQGWDASQMATRRAVRYVSAAAVSGAWQEVVSVRVCVLMRSVQPAPSAADVATYADCDNVSQTSPDGHLYRAFFSTLAVRNLGAF